MRRVPLLASAGLAALGLVGAGVASARPRSVTPSPYAVTAATSPASTGTAKRPLPIGLRLAATAAVPAGQRPATVQALRFLVSGLRVSTTGLATCSLTRIAAAGSDRVCSRRALVGTGTLEATGGTTGDPTDTTIGCHLELALYAAGPRRLALFLRGATGAPQPCSYDVADAVPVALSGLRSGTALSFALPADVRHPIAGADSAVARVTLTIPARTTTVHHRAVAFLSSAGGCARGRRAVVTTMTAEGGAATTKVAHAVCHAPRGR